MDISWLGHACFRLRTKEAVILTDPYSPETGYNLGQPAADIVTISHDHPGHSFLEGVAGSPKVVRGPGEYDIRDVCVQGYPAFHDAQGGRERGRNTIFRIEVEDLTVVHLGDLGHGLTQAQKNALGTVSILLVPVGGVSTIGPDEAAQVVRLLSPRLVLPMHYQTEARRELEPVAKFLAALSLAEVAPQPRLTISRSNLPAETRVVLLDYPRPPA